MRLIDADALLKRINYKAESGLGKTIAFTFKHFIDDAPTIESHGDLINRADAIEAVAGLVASEYVVKDGEHGFYTCASVAQNVLSALPSADAEWIPCSERLPKEDSRYLVQMSYGMMQVLSWANVLEKVDDVDFYNEKHGGWYEYDSEWGYCERHEVIAWMPLPKPYREDGEE